MDSGAELPLGLSLDLFVVGSLGTWQAVGSSSAQPFTVKQQAPSLPLLLRLRTAGALESGSLLVPRPQHQRLVGLFPLNSC